MPTRKVSLRQALDQFVDASIKSGRYDNASEVIRAGLRLLEQEEKKNLEKFLWLKQLSQRVSPASIPPKTRKKQ